MVKAPAVHLPFLAVRAGGEVAVTVQAKVKRDEVEAGSDPGDGGDDMQPAHREFEPLAQNDEVVHARSLHGVSSDAIPNPIFLIILGMPQNFQT